MKKVFSIVIAVLLMLALVTSSALAAPPPGKGNGIDFNGQHYNLNLIGKDKEMPGDKDNPDRHTMFVPLDTSDMTFPLETPNNLGLTELDGIKIAMTQGDEFAMVDGDATDGYGELTIGPGKYAVYIAVKAKKPNSAGTVDITGWVEAQDPDGVNWWYINVGNVVVSKNSKKFTDASTLFYVSNAEDPFGIVTDDMWVFDYMGALEGAEYSELAYFWQLMNDGAKLIQVRFYPKGN